MSMTTLAPASYDGREQAWIKHELLKSYLERLLMIVGMGGRRIGEIELCYVDCFAGPWGDDSEGLEGTSIGVSLQVMSQCRNRLKRYRVNATMRALYIERDPAAFQRLQAHLTNACPAEVKAECLQGDFVALRQAILQWCGDRAFAFFFVDPKGWKDVGISVLQPLLLRPGSEFLINFMYDFINRTASMNDWQQQIAQFLGGDRAGLQALQGKDAQEREEALVRTYRDGLRQALPRHGSRGAARTAHVRVMDPIKQRPKYHLVYLTSHPKGIVEFMEISEKLELVQRRMRAAKIAARHERRSLTPDLFGRDAYEPVTGQDRAAEHEVDGFWLQFLDEEPKRVGEAEMADFLESTGWMPGEYQASLLRLIEDGHVQNLDASGRRPKKPLHYDADGGQGERLILLPLGERSH